jgi:hypothetical protein
VLDHLQVADPAAAGRTLDPAGRTDGQVAPGDGGDVDFAGTAALQAQPLGVPLGELAGLARLRARLRQERMVPLGTP